MVYFAAYSQHSTAVELMVVMLFTVVCRHIYGKRILPPVN